jgi:nucleotide-binding universal stress UspA family protein
VLAEALAGFAASRPGLHLQREVLRGSARRRLTERSRGAQLVVVGHRRHRGLDTAMISSVGRHLVEHAACPILVVPTEPR